MLPDDLLPEEDDDPREQDDAEPDDTTPDATSDIKKQLAEQDDNAVSDMAAPTPTDDATVLGDADEATVKDMATAPPPESKAEDPVAASAEDDAVVADMASRPDAMSAPERDATPHGRYYVPPSDRTPDTRETRRVAAEDQRMLNELRSSNKDDIEPPTRVEEFDDEFNNRQQEGFDLATQGSEQNYRTGQSRQNQAALGMFGALSDSTLDITHELERMRFRLEADRL